MEKRCPKCNRTTSGEAKFCYKDGTPLVESSMTCECGNILFEVDDYCDQCGKAKHD
jgi:uncharacterized OB-fold protein